MTFTWPCTRGVRGPLTINSFMIHTPANDVTFRLVFQNFLLLEHTKKKLTKAFLYNISMSATFFIEKGITESLFMWYTYTVPRALIRTTKSVLTPHNVSGFIYLNAMVCVLF